MGKAKEIELMVEKAPGLLHDKRVAFTGRLASLTRTEAAKLVKSHGGLFTPTVSERTSHLVVGQDGWPLQKDGRLTAKLQKVQKLKQRGLSIQVIQEQEFLSWVSPDSSEGIHRLYVSSQLTNLLGISRDKLRSWMRAGLIRPVQTVDGLDYFDYSQVVSAKTLAELTQSGIQSESIRRSLEQLKMWMPDVETPLAQLAILDQDGELLLRVDDNLVKPTGQKVFDFDEEGVAAVPFNLPQDSRSAEEWFDLGCEYEDGGDLLEAADAYRQSLLTGGPNRDASFNLANVLYAMDHKSQAMERYYQSLELDKGFIEAWLNLGVVLRDLNFKANARQAFETALAIDPSYPDALYNLADMLDDLGRPEAAHQYWLAFANLDTSTKWGKYARQRLGAIGS